MIGKALQPGGRYLYVGFGSEHIHVQNAVPGPTTPTASPPSPRYGRSSASTSSKRSSVSETCLRAVFIEAARQ